MNKTFTILAFVLVTTMSFAQVGIGTKTPATTATLDLTATDKGFLPPRLSFIERDAIDSPASGLTIYNTDSSCLEFWNGLNWISVCDGNISLVPGPCAGEPAVIVFNSLEYKTVEFSGACWLDRNLGATRVATTQSDFNSYGSYYQWGRSAEGHEVFNSPITTTKANTPVPNTGGSWDGNFITTPSSPSNWLTPGDSNLWQGVSGVNNPCPLGYRLPNNTELQALEDSLDSNSAAGAFNSPLKIPSAGFRDINNGAYLGSSGQIWIWSSTAVTTVNGVIPFVLEFSGGQGEFNGKSTHVGASVRCIKN